MKSLIVKVLEVEPMVFSDNEWNEIFVKDGWCVVKKGLQTVFAAPVDKMIFYKVVEDEYTRN